VSQRHAQLTWSGRDLVVTDLGSANGTLIAGKKISRAQVPAGTVIRFGATRVEISGMGERGASR
jgi:pSer/pThr/pTyr-binding forkhead associated (FHA) protein